MGRRFIWGVLLLLGLMGCQSKGPAKTTNAKVGPVDDPKAAIVGRWTVDPGRVVLDALPENQRPIAKEMAQNVMNSMAFEFTPEEYRLTMTGRTYARPYSVVSVKGQVVTIKADDKGEAEVLELEFTDKGLELRAPGEKPLPLRPRG
jgi:hypothetical protein